MRNTATAALLAITGAAVAQPAITIEVENPVLMPGESTVVTMYAGFDPSDYAIAAVGTDVLSSGGSWGDLMLVAPMEGPGTSTGAASATGVDGILAGQLQFPLSQIYADPTNPIAFWQATYTADLVTDPTIVDLRTETVRFDVWIARDSALSVSRLADLTEGSATIRVIPAPASAMVLALGALAVRWRR